MNQVVRFVARESIERAFEYTDKFEFRRDRGWLRLQRLCFWLLGKIGAYSNGIEVKIEQHTINAKSFIENVLAQSCNLELFYQQRPTQLLIGAEDYAQMMRDSETTQRFSFDCKYYISHRGGEQTVCGLKVHVIPWMRGMLAMP